MLGLGLCSCALFYFLSDNSTPLINRLFRQLFVLVFFLFLCSSFVLLSLDSFFSLRLSLFFLFCSSFAGFLSLHCFLFLFASFFLSSFFLLLFFVFFYFLTQWPIQSGPAACAERSNSARSLRAQAVFFAATLTRYKIYKNKIQNAETRLFINLNWRRSQIVFWQGLAPNHLDSEIPSTK